MAGEIKVRRTMLRRASNFSVVLGVLVLVSCGRTRFHELRSVESCGWSRNDTLSFLFDRTHEPSAGEYNLSLEVRTGASYPFKNLVARVEILSAAGDSLIVADTLCCVLYDDKGNREGSTAGMLYQAGSTPVPVESGDSDTLTMRVSHIMDSDVISGVYDVGLRLCSSNGHGLRQSSGK